MQTSHSVSLYSGKHTYMTPSWADHANSVSHAAVRKSGKGGRRSKNAPRRSVLGNGKVLGSAPGIQQQRLLATVIPT